MAKWWTPRPPVVRGSPWCRATDTLQGCQGFKDGIDNFAISSGHGRRLARSPAAKPVESHFFHIPSKLICQPWKVEVCFRSGSMPARLLWLVHSGGAMELCCCNSTRWVPIPRDLLHPAGGLEEDNNVFK